MRFISLFLIVSLFLQPICSAQEEIVAGRSIIAQTKDAACKIMQWGKKGVSALVSPAGQWGLMAIFFHMWNHGRYINSNGIKISEGEPIAIDALPAAIQNAIKAMDLQKDVAFRVTQDVIYAKNNTVVLSKHLFSLSDEIQRYITSHELAHIKQNHQLKIALGAGCIIGLLFFAKKAVDCCAQNCKTRNWKDKAIMTAKKTCDFIATNPIVQFAIFMTLLTRLTQYYEREADLVAIAKTNCASGAVEWAYLRIAAAQERAANFSWFNPFCIVEKINDTLGWTWHDPRSKALEYLLPLAEQQALAAQVPA